MICIAVCVDSFFSQVQRKRNPHWRSSEMAVVFRDVILCATEGAERKGISPGVSLCEARATGARYPVVYIHHAEITPVEFKPYWAASHNIWRVLKSMCRTVNRTRLYEFELRFEVDEIEHFCGLDGSSAATKVDVLTDHVLQLLTEIGYFATTQLLDDPLSQSSPSTKGSRPHSRLLGPHSWEVLCHAQFLRDSSMPADVLPLVGCAGDPAACSNENTVYIQSSLVCADVFTDKFLNDCLVGLVDMWWDNCQIEIVSDVTSGAMFRLVNMYIELEYIPLEGVNTPLQDISRDDFMFSFSSDMKLVEIDQALELARIVVLRSKPKYLESQLHLAVSHFTLHTDLKIMGITGQSVGKTRSPHDVISIGDGGDLIANEDSQSQLPVNTAEWGYNGEENELGSWGGLLGGSVAASSPFKRLRRGGQAEDHAQPQELKDSDSSSLTFAPNDHHNCQEKSLFSQYLLQMIYEPSVQNEF